MFCPLERLWSKGARKLYFIDADEERFSVSLESPYLGTYWRA